MSTPLILVVDDTRDNRELYADFLEYEGFRVAQAADGLEALASIANTKPDLVLMDLAMPHLDGCEATRIIKSNPATKDVIVIVLTGHGTAANIARVRDAGAEDVLTKPFLPRDLLTRVRSRLGLAPQ